MENKTTDKNSCKWWKKKQGIQRTMPRRNKWTACRGSLLFIYFMNFLSNLVNLRTLLFHSTTYVFNMTSDFFFKHDEKFNNKKWIEKLMHQWFVFPFVIASRTLYPSMVQLNMAVQHNFGHVWVSTECARKHHCSTMIPLHVPNYFPTMLTKHRTILC